MGWGHIKLRREDYVNVRSLMLDNNNITKIEGLDRMTELRSLHLGGNRITEIEGLEAAQFVLGILSEEAIQSPFHLPCSPDRSICSGSIGVV